MSRKSFREFVEWKENLVKRPMMPPNVDPEDAVDNEIMKNPNMLMPTGTNPQAAKPVIDKAIQNKRVGGKNVSIAAALKAASLSKKHL